MLFIIYYRKQKIINDTGYYKILIFSIGILFYFISIFLITYSDYSGCLLNFIFKHCGISTSITILYIYIEFSSYLGMPNITNNKFQFSSENYSNNDMDENNCSKTLNQRNNTNNIEMRKDSTQDKKNNNKLYDRMSVMTVNDEIINKVKATRSSFIRISFFYLIYLLFILFIIIYVSKRLKNDDNNSDQDDSGEFFYKCNLEKYEIIFYILKLLVYITILLKGKKIIMFNYIFLCLRYITYASLIGIIFGPTTNVIINYKNYIKNNNFKNIILKHITYPITILF